MLSPDSVGPVPEEIMVALAQLAANNPGAAILLAAELS